jgi:hypothetical protein
MQQNIGCLRKIRNKAKAQFDYHIRLCCTFRELERERERGYASCKYESRSKLRKKIDTREKGDLKPILFDNALPFFRILQFWDSAEGMHAYMGFDQQKYIRVRRRLR